MSERSQKQTVRGETNNKPRNSKIEKVWAIVNILSVDALSSAVLHSAHPTSEATLFPPVHSPIPTLPTFSLSRIYSHALASRPISSSSTYVVLFIYLPPSFSRLSRLLLFFLSDFPVPLVLDSYFPCSLASYPASSFLFTCKPALSGRTKTIGLAAGPRSFRLFIFFARYSFVAVHHLSLSSLSSGLVQPHMFPSVVS
jgi:hypothetical protein